jgi:hypothetical protein
MAVITIIRTYSHTTRMKQSAPEKPKAEESVRIETTKNIVSESKKLVRSCTPTWFRPS